MKSRLSALRQKYLAVKHIGWIGHIVTFVFVLFLYFFVEMYNYRSAAKFFRFVKLHPKSALFGLLITVLLFAVIYLATRRAWIAGAGIGALYLICGIINFLKFALNGDNFAPWDLTMTGKMGELMSFVKIGLPWWGYVLPVIGAIAVLFLWFAEVRLPRFYLPIRIVSPILALAVLTVPLTTHFAVGTVKLFGMDFLDAALQSSNYRANGFVGAFTLNLASLSVEAPDGYDEQTVNEILDGYTETAATDKPDVIVILCESFWDIRKLPGTEFSVDPLQNFDEISKRKNARSGTIYTTALGGGTVRTEFDVLTGLTTAMLPSGATPHLYADNDYPTCVSEYKKQGYTTVALHPYDKSFYSRDKAYPHIGFDVFYGQSEIEQMLSATYQRGYVSDDTFADAVIQQMEQNKEDPTFLFGITMENHQTFYALNKYEFEVQNENLSNDLLSAVHTYAQGVSHSDAALKKLVDYIDSRKKDTLLVFFGDHLPTLGANYAAYAAAGLFDGEDIDEAESKVMYASPFVIYGNFDLHDSILKKDGNELSDYYLLSAAAELGGTSRSPYMNFLLDRFQSTPYYNARLAVEWDDTAKKFNKMQKLISYDRLLGKQYSVN